jgi:hypothetical protein
MQIEMFPAQPSALGEFVLGTSTLGTYGLGPLQTIFPAYVYGQYSDDPDIQAFFAAINQLGQGYLDWFLQTPLSVYTNDAINGSLLDWVGEGVYGISRPVVSTLTTTTKGQVASYAVNTLALNRHLITRSGTVSVATDDIYKRVLTWHLYLGDGRQMSIQWLRRRVARFLFGADGTDIPVSYLQQVSITQPPLPPIGALNTVPINTAALDTHRRRTALAAHSLVITIPTSPVAQIFQVLLSQGYLSVPFQVQLSVVLQ